MNPRTPLVYLLRHGQTEWSLSGQHTGLTDIPLTEKGKKEASLIAAGIHDVSFVKAFSSPLSRALETAQLAHLNCPIETRTDLLEWDYGEYEGIKTKDILIKNPGWNLFDHGAPRGENLDEVAKRADHIIREIRNINGDVAVISHGHYLRVFAARWLLQPPLFGKLIYLNTASISIVGYEHNMQEPIIKTWNSICHLK
ncbi:MAG: histidine phosphatase family protein [Chlamydiales bacterium]|nr:histidine phosphatase family protein [Chlamydiales bacterium]